MTMRWWFQTNSPYLMGVDNGSTTGMDFSDVLASDPDLWMVHWQEGRGEIERVEFDADNVASNLNGLREEFLDITPYVPLFQQFMERMKAKNLLVTQAKKIQIDLIKQIYEVQRQAPFHYVVAAGDYWWDASDATLYSSLIPALQNTIASINEIVARLNSVIPGLNTIDGSICSQVNSNVVAKGDALVIEINSNVVNRNNTMKDRIGANVVNPGNALIAWENNTVLGTYGTFGGANTVNDNLRRNVFTIGGEPYNLAAPGLNADIAHHTGTFIYLENDCYSAGVTTDFLNISYGGGVPWVPLNDVTGTNVQWIPIGATDPVPVTPAEARAIMQGITDRTNQLTLIKNQKIAEVNALTELDAVIAYDVLADWPPLYLPPGYKLEPSGMAGGGATIITSGGGGGGEFPEAPLDGRTYGRRMAAWNPALALSGDVLDGGSF